MNEFEKRLTENTAQLARIESIVSRLVDRLGLTYLLIADENEENDLNLNPYAVLCQIAKDGQKSSRDFPVHH
jgi:hypothetical protein